MDTEVTVAISLALASAPLSVYIGNPFGKYEAKIYKIRMSLLGRLEKEKDKLIDNELGEDNKDASISKSSDEFIYNQLMSFFKESPFLKYANEYQDMVHYEAHGEKKIEKLSHSTGALIGPTLLLQQEGDLYTIGIIWLMINIAYLAINFGEVTTMVKEIRRYYNEYVLGEQCFGGYDL